MIIAGADIGFRFSRQFLFNLQKNISKQKNVSKLLFIIHVVLVFSFSVISSETHVLIDGCNLHINY